MRLVRTVSYVIFLFLPVVTFGQSVEGLHLKDSGQSKAQIYYDLLEDVLSVVSSEAGSQMSLFTNNTEQVRIDAFGNVGIGTVAPAAKLDVVGGIKVGESSTCGSSQAGTLRWNPGATSLELCDGDSWLAMGSSGGPRYIAGSNSFAHGSCGATASAPCTIDISAAGFTSTPICTLTTSSPDETGYNENMVIRNITTTSLNVWRGLYYTSGSTMLIRWICIESGSGGGSSGGESLWTESGDDIYYENGNVGIGTTTPGHRLTVQGHATVLGAGNTFNLIGSGAPAVGNYSLIEANSGDDSVRARFGFGDQVFSGADPYESSIGTLSNTSFSVYSNNQRRMIVAADGNVGVGTMAPDRTFHVRSPVSLPSPIARFTGPVAYSGLNLSASTAGGYSGRFLFQPDTIPGSGTAQFLTHFSNSSSGPGATVHNMGIDGNLGLGTISPSYKLHVVGTAYATGAAGALSDRRHKKNIHDLPPNGLSVINHLRPVTYEWISPSDQGMQGVQLGFIAQEVEEVLPEVIIHHQDSDGNDVLGFKPTALLPILVKAIQEANDLLEKSQEDYANLRSENDKYKDRVGNLKREIDSLKKENKELRRDMSTNNKAIRDEINDLKKRLGK